MSNIIWDSSKLKINPLDYEKGEFERLHLCNFECEPLTDKEKADIKEFEVDEREYFKRQQKMLSRL